MSCNTIITERCIGCTSCVNSCPTNAIIMTTDEDGFYTAKISSELCIQCGKCSSVCPIINGVIKDYEFVSAYAGYNKSNVINNKSTSGGLFYTMAKYVIENMNGVVCGATMDDSLKVKHIVIDKVIDIEKLQGSKYVQSNVGNSFYNIKKLLDEKRVVLFSGTPCQVNGLKRFLNNDYDNLITVDLVCHGVPSPKMFNDYITFLEKKYRSKILEYKFRCKNHKCAQSYDTKIVFHNGKNIIISGDDDVFTNNYLANKLQNKNCYDCRFTSLKRDSDITLGDYWGIEESHPEIVSNYGISLVLVNTLKGQKIFENISDEIYFVKTTKEKILRKNNHLKTTPVMNNTREIIFSKYRKIGFSSLFYYKYFIGKKLGIYLLKRKIRRFIK